MSAINTVVRRWENGGVVTIDGDTISNVEAGTLKWTPAMRTRIEYKDRGIPQAPLEGDDGYSDIELEVKIGDYEGVDSIYTKLMAAGSSGLAKQLTNFIVTIPNYRGASAGQTITWTTSGTSVVYVSEPPSYTAGGENDGLDKLTVKLRATFAPTIATY